jgi:hypothetical protein
MGLYSTHSALTPIALASEPYVKTDKILTTYDKRTADPLLISEVTRMSGATRCVAGLNLRTQRMVRPLQANGNNWQLGDDRSIFGLGSLLHFQPTGIRNATLPHGHEDTPLVRLPVVLQRFTESVSYKLLADAAQRSVQAAIGSTIEDNKYIVENTDCHSLGACEVPRRTLVFYTGARNKLRLHFTDGEGVFYDLGVTCDRLQGLNADTANKWLDTCERDESVLLRLGLARPWDGKELGWSPKRCYLQVNGVMVANDRFEEFAPR